VAMSKAAAVTARTIIRVLIARHTIRTPHYS
jgi:hypothetical protein